MTNLCEIALTLMNDDETMQFLESSENADILSLVFAMLDEDLRARVEIINVLRRRSSLCREHGKLFKALTAALRVNSEVILLLCLENVVM